MDKVDLQNTNRQWYPTQCSTYIPRQRFLFRVQPLTKVLVDVR